VTPGAEVPVPFSRGVVCDLFHTLVDPEAFRPRTFLRGPFLAQKLGLEADPFARFWHDSYGQRARARSPSVEDRVSEYCRGVRSERSVEAVRAAVLEMGQYQDLALERPRPEVVAALRSIRRSGVRVGLLSNTDESEVRQWSTSPLSDCFDFVGFSCDLGYAKPEPEAYAAVLRGLGDLPAAECTYLGDGASDELTGARRAGFGQVLFMRGFVGGNGMRSAEEVTALSRQADGTVDTIGQLSSLLRRAE
jgi:putative hydrolase of the HAD superfamily